MKLELSIHASKLKNVAGLGKGTSDPFAVVTQLATTPGSTPKVLGKTEAIHNTLSPQWVKTFPIDYELGVPVKIVVSVFDEEKKGDNKPMGSAIFEIGELLGARGNTKAKKLKQGGNLFATVQKSAGSGVLRLEIKGTKLKNVEGMFSKSDPFFELARKVDSAGGLTWDNVYRSKPLKNNLNPQWEAAVIELSTLCGGDLNLPIQVSVFDFESSGKHSAMGRFETTVAALQKAAASGEPIKLLQKGKEAGTISVTKAEVSGIESSKSAPAMAGAKAVATAAKAPPPAARATFVDYVSGGCELNVVVAIDFTGSNGDPRKPGTLHYLNPASGRNDYEKVIVAILTILSQYDADQMFPVLGFGAKYNGAVSHCFQCGPTAEVKGVQGVLDAYHAVFKSGLVMSGPTVMTEIIDSAAARANSLQDQARARGKQAYTILLAITDGAVSDVHATAACLDRNSDSPLSIVIVGVGDADFSGMQFLDDWAKPGKRDIVQFVQFNKHCANSIALTSETLKEIPNQVTGWFASKGIDPLPFQNRSDSDIFVEPEDEEIDLSLNIGVDDEIIVAGGGDDFVDGFNAKCKVNP